MGGGHCVFSNYSNYLAALQKLWVFLGFFTSFFGENFTDFFSCLSKSGKRGRRLRESTVLPLANLKRDSQYFKLGQLKNIFKIFFWI